VITALNIVGGLIVGMVQLGMGFTEALQTFTMLTVGDGLVSQIPSLIISTAAGVIVTRAASESNLGYDIISQLFSNPRVAWITAGVLLLLGMAPGMPVVPFFFLSAGMGATGFLVHSRSITEAEVTDYEESEEPEKEDIEHYLRIDPVELEIGYNLIPLVDVEQNGDLLDRITQIRKQIALELGIIIPPIRIRDNIHLKPTEYQVLIKGNIVAKSELEPGYKLAINPGTAEEEVEGIETNEPSFGLPAVWVNRENEEKAELVGYTIVTPSAVLVTHLAETLKNNADLILSRQDVQKLMDNLKQDQPALVDELVPNVFTLGIIEKILRNLLTEKVSVRDLGTILETLSEYSATTKDLDILTEYARQALGRTIAAPYISNDGKIHALTVAPELEQLLTDAVTEVKKIGAYNSQGLAYVLSTEVLQKLLTALSKEVERVTQGGNQPIVVTVPNIRIYLRKLIEPVLKNLIVLSFAEIPPNVEIESLGMVRIE
jgi:flagellar biosynthesis protein FlhA